MPQPSQAHVHVCMDMHSKAKHTDIPTGCLQASVQVQDAGSGSLKLFLDSDRSRRACDDSDLHWAVFPPFKLRLQNSVNWLLNWWDNEHYGGPESCADLPLSQWHALLAPFPVVKCTIASPPLDAGVPCVQREGKKKTKQGTFSWVTFIPVILNTGEAATSASWFASSFLSLSLTVSWADVFAIIKSIET